MKTLHPSALAAAALAGLLAGGCALQDPPDREQLRAEGLANLKSPTAWTGAPAGSAAVAAGWLARFADAQLDALVAEAQAYNTDLAVASSRVEQAAASLRIAGSSLMPAVGAFAKGGTKLGGDMTGVTGGGISASWEIDLWGRVRYGQRAAENSYLSTQADLAYARQSVAALVAKAWFLTIEATQQLAMARDTVQASERLLTLTNDRLRVGAGTELDVAVARANVNSFRDGARNIEAARLQAIRALETLLGRYPSASAMVPAAWAPMPAPGEAGLPTDLLERRPDVVAAERRVAAAWDRVGEAKAARLPRLSLSAALSTISSDLFVLQNVDNPSVSAGASLLAPIFTGGALEGTQELRTAEQRQAVALWAQTALRAFSEVENSLSNEASLVDREAILTAAVTDSQRAVVLQESRYQVGSTDLRSVLQQQIALYATRMSLLRVQADMRVQRVNLYLALGGDFAVAPAGTPK
jgi:NodT family efflux transporter outer membrane factor (OMF) lipoprotein